jgi:hypothetical protein
MSRLSFKVRLQLLSAELGGRQRPIFSDYRPSWDLKNTWHGRPTINDGRVLLDGIDELAPGTEGAAIIEPLSDEFWEWRFHFDVHWGDHAVDALRALHRACREQP